jgi:fructose 1,6-bisphosphate aldolase/phosphatase
MRGAHIGPLTPVKLNTPVSYFDGPPIVSCAALCVRHGKLTETVDAFDHPYWDYVRHKASKKAEEIRKQGFFGNAMVGKEELEYTGIKEKLRALEPKFQIRKR